MAVQNRASLLTQIATLLADNATQDISEADIRAVNNDAVDSCFNLLTDGSVAVLGDPADFVAGVSNSVTMPNASPGDREELVRVYFDAAKQAPDQWSISGTTLTFTSTIPVGVESITIEILAS